MTNESAQEAVLRGIRLLADRLEAHLEGDETALETLGESLEQSELSIDELRTVVLVLRSLGAGDGGGSESREHRAGDQAHRVLSPQERTILVPEAWGYLLWLRSQGSLDAGQCERVLDLVWESGIRPVSVEQVRDAAVRVAMTQEEPSGTDDSAEHPLGSTH